MVAPKSVPQVHVCYWYRGSLGDIAITIVIQVVKTRVLAGIDITTVGEEVKTALGDIAITTVIQVVKTKC